jgi:putative Mn2+ efflux pump MntP
MILFDLLNAHERKSTLLLQLTGYVFISMGVLIGLWLLFLYLAPLIGDFESGMIACTLLIILGTVLIFIGQQKKASPQEESVEKIENFFKDLDIEKLLKNNALLISLLSLGMGFILSQMKNIKNLSHIYKIFK